MFYFKLISFVFLCFLSFKGINSNKVYLLDFHNIEDTDLINNYDDYDPINEFVDNEEDFIKIPENNQEILGLQPSNHKRLSMPIQIDDPSKLRCHRIYGSIYGNIKPYNRCPEQLQNKRTRREAQNRKRPHRSYEHANKYDRLGFSQDYLDVGDLGRTDRPDEEEYGRPVPSITFGRPIRNTVPQRRPNRHTAVFRPVPLPILDTSDSEDDTDSAEAEWLKFGRPVSSIDFNNIPGSKKYILPVINTANFGKHFLNTVGFDSPKSADYGGHFQGLTGNRIRFSI